MLIECAFKDYHKIFTTSENSLKIHHEKQMLIFLLKRSTLLALGLSALGLKRETAIIASLPLTRICHRIAYRQLRVILWHWTDNPIEVCCGRACDQKKGICFVTPGEIDLSFSNIELFFGTDVKFHEPGWFQVVGRSSINQQYQFLFRLVSIALLRIVCSVSWWVRVTIYPYTTQLRIK